MGYCSDDACKPPLGGRDHLAFSPLGCHEAERLMSETLCRCPWRIAGTPHMLVTIMLIYSFLARCSKFNIRPHTGYSEVVFNYDETNEEVKVGPIAGEKTDVIGGAVGRESLGRRDRIPWAHQTFLPDWPCSSVLVTSPLRAPSESPHCFSPFFSSRNRTFSHTELSKQKSGMLQSLVPCSLRFQFRSFAIICQLLSMSQTPCEPSNREGGKP